MRSKTKFKVSNEKLRELFYAAGLNDVSQIAPLGKGEFNAVHLGAGGGKEAVIKIAPDKNAPVMSCEKDMLRSELFWYGKLRNGTGIRVPEVLFPDFSQKLIPTNYFIMERLDGETLDSVKLSKEERVRVTAEVARMAAEIHRVKNDKYGYIQTGLYDNWYLAIRAMTGTLIKDAADRGKKSKNGEKLLYFIDKHKGVLENAECCMVNFDLWKPNFICKRAEGVIEIALIDPERCFWGDRIADFVCMETMQDLPDKKISIEAYNAVADKPIERTQEGTIRYAAALGYLALIMETERYYRYSPISAGRLRNLIASRHFFGRAFKLLDK